MVPGCSGLVANVKVGRANGQMNEGASCKGPYEEAGGFGGDCKQRNDIAAGPSPLVRLSTVEYRNTLRDLFPKVSLANLDVGLPAEVQSEGFLNTAEVQAPSAALIEALARNAQIVATAVAADPETFAKLLPCAATNKTQEASCGATFVRTFGRLAFRRPLTAHETTRYCNFVSDATAKWGFTAAVRLTVEAFLQSASFLYRMEIGGNPVAGFKVIELDGFELASRIAYFLTDTMPDETLLAAAEAGKLATRQGLEEQVRRLLERPEARAAVASFHSQWLGFDRMDKVAKAPDLFPSFNSDVAAALRESTERYVDRIFWDEGHTLASLLTDKHAFVNSMLAPIYGLTATGKTLTWTDVDANQRSGILTQPGLLSAFARERSDAPVLRGVFVLDRLLCQPPSAPPPNVSTTLPALVNGSQLTTRQQLEQSHAANTCAGCHDSIDGIGFGFGNFDALGQWRTKEFGITVDTKGEFLDLEGIEGTFENAIDMAAKLAANPQVSSCVATQWLAYALGVRRENLTAGMTDPLVTAFNTANGDMRELLVALTLSDAFRYRPSTL